ncbi:MAG: hypothetical protein SGJ19_05670 [Planctomycetia bacterium]|nr:hypothetical protein [Planctomycetia bacterium]
MFQDVDFWQLSPIPLLLAFAGAVWWIFIRPVPRLTVVGTIVAKDYKGPETYRRYQVGGGRDFRPPTEMKIADGYVFTIRAEGLSQDVRYTLNTVAAQRFDIGQRVEVTFEVRGIPGIWRVQAGVDMRAA